MNAFKPGDRVRHKPTDLTGIVRYCENRVAHGVTRVVVDVETIILDGIFAKSLASWWADECEAAGGLGKAPGAAQATSHPPPSPPSPPPDFY